VAECHGASPYATEYDGVHVNRRRPLVLRLLIGFARFWWDFLIGDTPELFVAALTIIGVIALLSEVAGLNVAAIVSLPLLVIVSLGLSLYRAQRTSKR
jgi:hypothetical protein